MQDAIKVITVSSTYSVINMHIITYLKLKALCVQSIPRDAELEEVLHLNNEDRSRRKRARIASQQ